MNIPFPLQKQVSNDDVKAEIQALQANVARVIELRGALVAALVALEEEAKQLLTSNIPSPLEERPLIGISQMNFGQCAAAHVFSGLEIHIMDDVLRFAVTPDAKFTVSFHSGRSREGEHEELLIGGSRIDGLEAPGTREPTTLVVRPANAQEIKVKTADLLAVLIAQAAADWRDRAHSAGQAVTGG
jgi:hypothetical protein